MSIEKHSQESGKEKPIIAVSAASFAKDQDLRTELRDLEVQAEFNHAGRVLSEVELVDFFAQVKPDAAIVGTEIISPAVLNAAPGLRLIAKYGVGLDNIDQPELERRGIKLAWTPGTNREAVAELALTFALGHWRNVFSAMASMREGRWVKDGGWQLAGKRVGIVGFGQTGAAFANLLRVFGTEVAFTDIIDKSHEALNARSATYEELIATSDILSFHVPATPLTLGMFGRREIASAKKTLLVINTSRGSVVDFEATCEAVSDGRLGGFAADVFPDEPCDVSRWRNTPHLYFTPHIGGNSREAVKAMGRAAIAHVKAFVKNAPG